MKQFLWSLFEVVETVVIAVVAVVLIRTFVAQPFLVSGSSMEPTFQNGNYLLVDEMTYRFREPERGEVIVFKNPVDESSYYIKRIIGLPGEQVTVSGNTVTVSSNDGDQVLHEDYIKNIGAGGRYDMELSPGEYFVMGDNRGFSFDSRSWGALTDDHIIGLVRLRLWPVHEAMAIVAPAY